MVASKARDVAAWLGSEMQRPAKKEDDFVIPLSPRGRDATSASSSSSSSSAGIIVPAPSLRLRENESDRQVGSRAHEVIIQVLVPCLTLLPMEAWLDDEEGARTESSGESGESKKLSCVRRLLSSKANNEWFQRRGVAMTRDDVQMIKQALYVSSPAAGRRKRPGQNEVGDGAGASSHHKQRRKQRRVALNRRVTAVMRRGKSSSSSFSSSFSTSTATSSLHPMGVFNQRLRQDVALGTGDRGLSCREIHTLANAFRSRCTSGQTFNRFHPRLARSAVSAERGDVGSRLHLHGDLGLTNLMHQATESIRRTEIDDLYGQTMLHLLRVVLAQEVNNEQKIDDWSEAGGTSAGGQQEEVSLAATLDVIGGMRLLLHAIGDDDTPDTVELNAMSFGIALLEHDEAGDGLQRDMCSHLEAGQMASLQFFGALSRRLSSGQSTLTEVFTSADLMRMRALCCIPRTDPTTSFYTRIGTLETLLLVRGLAAGHFSPGQNRKTSVAFFFYRSNIFYSDFIPYFVFQLPPPVLCREHQERSLTGTLNMTTLIVSYAETLVDLLLRVDVLDAVDGSNSSRNDDSKDEDTMQVRKGSVTGSVLLLHSQSIVVTDLDMCFQCLRDIVDGPHHLNQYYLSSSTPFLGICNRLMRHFQARRNRASGRRNVRNMMVRNFSLFFPIVFLLLTDL